MLVTHIHKYKTKIKTRGNNRYIHKSLILRRHKNAQRARLYLVTVSWFLYILINGVEDRERPVKIQIWFVALM